MTYFICRIPFGTSELKIKTLEEIDDVTASEISYFANTFYNELNPNIVNSSAYKFNHGQVGIPLFIKKEYLEFLSQHLDLVLMTNGEYQPFLLDELFENDSEKLMTLDRRSNSVVKNREVQLERTINRKHFTIDVLSDYILTEKKIKDFLIVSDSIFLARGNHSWKVDIGHHIQDDFTLEIRNESIVIEPMEVHVSTSRFGERQETVPIEYVFLQGNYTNLPKVVGNFAKQAMSLGELRMLSSRYKIIIHALDKSEKLTTFSPVPLD
ncbi:MAG: hypothetical protein ACMG57_06000 [Candidatus Dojkabacteria bacterium]